MNAIKVTAGHYCLITNHGTYDIRNFGSKDWRTFNRRGSEIERFPTLAMAEQWLTSQPTAPASKKSVKYLRDLATRYADTALGQRVAAHFRPLSDAGTPFGQTEVSQAIKWLKALDSSFESARSVLPRQRAINEARAAIRQAQLTRPF